MKGSGIKEIAIVGETLLRFERAAGKANGGLHVGRYMFP